MAEQVSYKGMDSFFQVGKITFMQLPGSLRPITNLCRSWVDNYTSHRFCRLPERGSNGICTKHRETYFAIHGSANGCHQCLNLAV